jgi:chemotaxis protein histidine kinase CheA
LAKNSDHLSRSFETDNTGGVLSGLLADEDELDHRALWRIGSWGVGAVGAVVVAVMANQSSLGLKHEQMAAADLSRQAQQFQMAAKETQNETRRLASAIDTLNGDRDRLYSRVTSLEQGLETATGAFIRQVSPAGAPPGPTTLTTEPQTSPNPGPAPVIAPVVTAPAPDKPVAKTTVPEPGPAPISSVAKDLPKTEPAKTEAAREFAKAAAKIEAAKVEAAKIEAAKAEAAKIEAAKSDVAKTEPAKAESAKTDQAKSELAKSELAKSDHAKSDLAKTDPPKTDLPKIDVLKVDVANTDPAKADATKPPGTQPATPLVAAKSFMAPPDPAAARLIEPGKPAGAIVAGPIPEVVATAPAASDEEADEATAPKVALHRTEFGVDLGSANSVSGLRALWRGLLKSRSNAQLLPLRPIIMIKEATNGLGMQLHLVAGPLNDAGAAAKICAVMTENDRKCETAIFDGQRLTLKADDVPQVAPEKPVSRSRRGAGAAKRAATVEEPPAKKPETTSSISSSISSMFGRKKEQ